MNAYTFAFLIFILFLMLFSRFLLNRWVCPFNVMALAPASIALFLWLLGGFLQYNTITERAYFLVASALFCFWTGQMASLALAASMTNHLAATPRFPLQFEFYEKYLWLAALLSLFASAVLHYKAYLSLGLTSFGDDEIGKIVGRGPLAHLRLMGYPAFIVFSVRCLQTGKLKYIFISSLLLASSFLMMVKYHAILPILTTIMFISIFRIRINKFFLVILLASIFVLFMANYWWIFYFRHGELSPDRIRWVFFHLLDYIVGGFINLGEKIKYLPASFGEINLSSFIFISTPKIISHWLGISLEYTVKGFEFIRMNHVSNVGTIFYYTYEILGYVGTLLFMTILGFLSGSIFLFALYSRNDSAKILTAHVFAVLMLSSFFGNYFNFVAPWEYGLWIVVWSSLYRFRFLPKNSLSVATKDSTISSGENLDHTSQRKTIQLGSTSHFVCVK